APGRPAETVGKPPFRFDQKTPANTHPRSGQCSPETYVALLMRMCIVNQSCIAWWLGPEGRGAYAVCLVFASLLMALFTFASDVAVTRLVASKHFTLSQGVTQSVLYSTLGSLLAVIFGVLAMQYPSAFFTKADTHDFYLALASIPVTSFAMSITNITMAVRRFDVAAILSVLQPGIQLAFTVLLVECFSLEVTGAL
ncbi:MAG TPA: hypothetical protein VI136_10355, partial [Verrucomicrobiae bacterium]